MKLLSFLAEQRVDVAVFAAVSVQFDEAPVRAAADVNSASQPLFETLRCRRSSMKQVAVFNAWHDATSSVLPIKSQRPLNHQ